MLEDDRPVREPGQRIGSGLDDERGLARAFARTEYTTRVVTAPARIECRHRPDDQVRRVAGCRHGEHDHRDHQRERRHDQSAERHHLDRLGTGGDDAGHRRMEDGGRRQEVRHDVDRGAVPFGAEAEVPDVHQRVDEIADDAAEQAPSSAATAPEVAPAG